MAAEQRNIDWWKVRWEEWALQLIKLVSLTELNNRAVAWALDLAPADMPARYRKHWQKVLSMYPDEPFTLDTFRSVEPELETFRAAAAMLPNMPPEESIATRLKADIRDAARRLRGVRMAQEAQAGYLTAADVDNVDSRLAEGVLMAAAAFPTKALSASTLTAALDAEDERYAAEPLQAGQVRGYGTRLYPGVDGELGGWHPEELTLIAGRPSMGKSTLLAIWMACLAGAGCTGVLYNFEMPALSYWRRLATWRSFTPMRDVISGALFQPDYPNRDALARYNKAKRWLGTLPLEIVQAAGMNMQELFSDAVRRKRRDGLVQVGIDTLNLVRFPEADFRQGMTNLSHAAARLAKEHQLIVTAAVQLSRASKMRADKRAQLDDMREAGALEEDADVVIAPFQPYYYTKDPADRNVMEVAFLKNRNRGTGRTVVMDWRPEMVGAYERKEPAAAPAPPPTALDKARQADEFEQRNFWYNED